MSQSSNNSHIFLELSMMYVFTPIHSHTLYNAHHQPKREKGRCDYLLIKHNELPLHPFGFFPQNWGKKKKTFNPQSSYPRGH
jgi:hypothetical protein